MRSSRRRRAQRSSPLVVPPIVAVVALLVAACGDAVGVDQDRVRGSGDIVTVTRDIDAFDRIVLAGEGRVLLAEGAEGRIEIATDDNIVGLITTTVADSTLTISTERDVEIDPTDGVAYRLGCPEVTQAKLSGAGLIDLSGCATADRLSLELAGAGNVTALELDVSTLVVSIPGAGQIRTAGVADRLEVVIDGVGDLDASDLRSTDAEIESTGVGTATVWATDQLDLRLTGVGSVEYFGEPRVTSSVTGVGSVDALGSK